MGIKVNFDKTVEVQRLVADESGNGEEYFTHLASITCHIQPLDDSFGQDLEGNFGKDWLMFTCYKDILEGDRVIDGADDYRVVGVERFKFLGKTRHMEVRIRKSNP